MRLICLDLEGVLIPEIWIAFSEAVNIPELRLTTRDEPDYDKLMRGRLELLKQRGLKLPDIRRVIDTMAPLEGAVEFIKTLKERTQVVILSDTYEEFARPLMAKLGYPTLFCNSFVTARDGSIIDYKLRQKEGKKHAVAAFKSLNIEVFAAGDSFNDLSMIREAGNGCLFRAPEKIKNDNRDLVCVDTFDGLLSQIGRFLSR
jgi:phosphoserine/homoserine phosphotransferase